MNILSAASSTWRHPDVVADMEGEQETMHKLTADHHTGQTEGERFAWADDHRLRMEES